MAQGGYLLHLLLVQVVVQPLQHAVEGHLGGVGDEGEDGVVDVVVGCLQDAGHQLLSQQLAFAVDVHVAAAAEVDALEGAGTELTGLVDLHRAQAARLADEDGLSRLQFADAVGRHVEHGLYHRTLAGQHGYLVVLIPEGRTDAPRVADGKALAAARQAAHHVAAVPLPARRAQHVGQVHMFLYVVGDAHTRQPFGFGLVEQALHLAVQAVAHLLEHDVGIGILAGMLPHGGDAGKYFVDVGQVEVAAKGEVLGTPVVAAQERMYIRESGLSGGGIAQVAHIDFTGKRKVFLSIVGIGQLLGRQVLEVALHGGKDFGNGSRAQGPFAEHVFLAGIGRQLDAGQPGPFLSAVVLLFHQQIELVEPVHPRAILFLIIVERLEQAYHRHTAFMF